jgi:hypothetical protein
MCVFVGYDKDHKAYRLFDPRTQSVIVSNQVRFDQKRFPFEEGTAINHVVEKDFASGTIAGGVSGVLVSNNNDLFESEDVSKIIPTPPTSETESEFSNDSDVQVEELDQDKSEADIAKDDRIGNSDTSNVSGSESDSEWSPSVAMSDKNVWLPVSGRRAAKRAYSPSSSRESSPKAASCNLDILSTKTLSILSNLVLLSS